MRDLAVMYLAAAPGGGAPSGGGGLASLISSYISPIFWVCLAGACALFILRGKITALFGALLGALVFSVVMYSPDTIQKIGTAVAGVI